MTQHASVSRVKSPFMERPAAPAEDTGEQVDSGLRTPKAASPTKLFRKVSFETQGEEVVRALPTSVCRVFYLSEICFITATHGMVYENP